METWAINISWVPLDQSGGWEGGRASAPGSRAPGVGRGGGEPWGRRRWVLGKGKGRVQPASAGLRDPGPGGGRASKGRPGLPLHPGTARLAWLQPGGTFSVLAGACHRRPDDRPGPPGRAGSLRSGLRGCLQDPVAGCLGSGAAPGSGSARGCPGFALPERILALMRGRLISARP